MTVCFTDDIGQLESNASDKAKRCYDKLKRDHPGMQSLCMDYNFTAEPRSNTPVTSRKGALHIIQLLPGKKAAIFRANMATLLERVLEGDIALAEEITDRALAAHMAKLDKERADRMKSA